MQAREPILSNTHTINHICVREEVLHNCATRSTIRHATRHVPPSSDSPLSRSSASFSAQTFALKDRSLHPNGNPQQIALYCDDLPPVCRSKLIACSGKHTTAWLCKDNRRESDPKTPCENVSTIDSRWPKFTCEQPRICCELPQKHRFANQITKKEAFPHIADKMISSSTNRRHLLIPTKLSQSSSKNS